MIPFSPPRIDQKIIDEVVDTLKSGWITTGPKTKLFEKKLSEYYGCKATLCLNSATAGLELMLRWFGVKEGDEVIIPAYTYSATANVVIHCGAIPVFVDVNDDFNISVAEIEKAIQENNYRVAIRLMFLRALKNLAQKNVIHYKQEQTNFDYLMQLHTTTYYKDFFRLTRHYEYAWYGQFAVSNSSFAIIKKEFENFDRQFY